MATRFLRIAVVYLVIGVVFGIWMGITQQFQFAPAHAHLNLLGWASLALMGVIYHLFPAAARTRLAHWHFWLYNIGAAGFVISLTCVIAGNEHMRQPLIIASNVIIVGVVLFAINVFANVREATTSG
jgi:cbb3-type cytochrome oxidase subunit 1